MKKKPGHIPFLPRLLKKIAPRIGARVVVEPRWKHVAQIVFKSGVKRYVRYSSIDLNPMGASEIARDKDYANFFMKKLGYPSIPQSQAFYSDAWCKAIGSDRSKTKAYAHAKRIGFPVMVKPNSKSQGVGVSKVYDRNEFYEALNRIFAIDRIALVERAVSGKDYRLVVLNNKVISAYERLPLSVTGDGTSSIEKLLREKQESFKKLGRDTRIKIRDPRIVRKLAREHMSLLSIPSSGENIFLLDNANLSSGGDSIDVTEKVHRDFKKLAVNLTRDMGLHLCGVDLMVRDGIEKAPVPKKYWIIEINSAPGLDHYAKSGTAQKKIVEDLYLEVLKGMERV